MRRKAVVFSLAFLNFQSNTSYNGDVCDVTHEDRTYLGQMKRPYCQTNKVKI